MNLPLLPIESELTYRPLTQMAEKHAIDPWLLSWWCQTGRVTARRWGDQWFVMEAALVRHLASRPSGLLSTGDRSLLPALAGALLLVVVFLAGGLGRLPQALNERAASTSLGMVNQSTAVAVTDIAIGYWFAGLTERLTDWGGFWYRAVFGLARYLAEKVGSNWRTFLAGEMAGTPDVPLGDLAKLDDYLAVREQLRKEIVEELRREIAGQTVPFSTTGQAFSGAPARGLVVVPSAGPITDTELKGKLQTIFSDEVSVRFDESGTAGVISPIFRGTNERGDYLFILTPIRR